ncbi:tetratricopeptide repeat protein, partial [Streptomyces sp. SID10853]|nr:tetratricopeptide repeat protein [Streptomyces sp. SID10853]
MAMSREVRNPAFRQLRGQRSPGEFAAAIRRAAREIGEQVSCDARYIGRVEAGEIRCPNYAYERVFLHMFPGSTLKDLGFSDRGVVRGRGVCPGAEPPSRPPTGLPPSSRPCTSHSCTSHPCTSQNNEESDVLRRAFMAGGSAAMAAVSLGLGPAPVPSQRHVGEAEVSAVEAAVRQIRLLDDRHGAAGLYQRAARPLEAAYALLDAGTARRSAVGRL